MTQIHNVSILDLMECLFRPYPVDKNQANTACFNP